MPDPHTAAEFYRHLLGWELEDMMPPNSARAVLRRAIARSRRGGHQLNGGGDATHATWNTYIWVENTDETAGAPPGFTDAVGWLQAIPSDAESQWSVTPS